MNKTTKTLLIIGVLAVGAYLAFRWYSQKKATESGAPNTGAISSGTGSNLNSVAPDLIGGSTAGGTYAGPGASIPVNITVNSSPPPSAPGAVNMQGMSSITPSPLTSQSTAAAASPGAVGGGSTSPATGLTSGQYQTATAASTPSNAVAGTPSAITNPAPAAPGAKPLAKPPEKKPVAKKPVVRKPVKRKEPVKKK